MPKYEEFERKVIDFFKRQYLASAKEKAVEEIYDLVVEHRYGPGARTPLMVIDWKSVFKENRCPACGGMMSLQKNRYLCGDCPFTIPLELYDRASKQYEKDVELAGEEDKLVAEMRKKGFDNRRVEALYETAVDEAMGELDAEDRRREIASRRKGGEGDEE